ncbi:MAG TPA: hypothetical protein VI564_02090 [Candidatus Nanoarchaeia archaeon]|nr:hypothetical protein [Candidatus Nanoarchaeia archaeon]
MKKKVNNYSRIFKITMLIAIFILSYFITNLIREQFPSIQIKESTLISILPDGTKWIFGQPINTSFSSIGKSELHHYCSKNNESSLTIKIYDLDKNSIRIGDQVIVTSNVETEGELFNHVEIFSGIHKERLKKVNKGNTDLEMIYFDGNNITTYTLSCMSLEDLGNPKWNNSSIVSRNNFKRPSFIDSKVGFWIVFITVFVLLSQFFEQIKKFFE